MNFTNLGQRGLAAGIFWLLLTTVAEAGPVKLAWDANTESNIAGYLISYGTAAGVRPNTVDVGNRTSWNLNLAGGQRYYFAVQAYNTSGLFSGPSNEVNTLVPGFVDADGDGMDDGWEAKYGTSVATADDDGDGIRNIDEFRTGTNPILPNTWYLTEGATGGFLERVALVNPDDVPAAIRVQFLKESGEVVTASYDLGPLARMTVVVNDVPGLEQTAASAVVTSLQGGVVAERTMFLKGPGGELLLGHTGRAVQAPATRWYLAEGDAGFFNTWILVANANAAAATLTVKFLLDGGDTVTRQYNIGANSRLSIWANEVPGVVGSSFSTQIDSTAPVTVERAMYFFRESVGVGGHAAPAVTQPATSWFVAEGHTGQFFDTWLLLANPNTQPATATITFLTAAGLTETKQYSLPATSRTTVRVDDVPGLEDTAVSSTVTSNRAIIVERSMYWPGDWHSWYEAHTSVGLTRTGTQWVLAEGENGGPQDARSYVQLANPGNTAADVQLTFLRAGGRPPVAIVRRVEGHSRLTVNAAEAGLDDEQFGVVIDSTQPIAVEHSLYWSLPWRWWVGGSNEVGVRVR